MKIPSTFICFLTELNELHAASKNCLHKCQLNQLKWWSVSCGDHSRLQFCKGHFFSDDSHSLKMTEQQNAYQTFGWPFLDFLRLVFGIFKPEDHSLMLKLML